MSEVSNLATAETGETAAGAADEARHAGREEVADADSDDDESTRLHWFAEPDVEDMHAIAIALAATLIFPFIIGTLGDLDGGLVAAGYFGAFSFDGLSIALHCFYKTDSLNACIHRVVNFLGDADTTGAIAAGSCATRAALDTAAHAVVQRHAAVRAGAAPFYVPDG